jgi:hypothetical protein
MPIGSYEDNSISLSPREELQFEKPGGDKYVKILAKKMFDKNRTFRE